jgi:hypothetical protein
MPTTYKKIATVTVGSGGAADIQFTSIPGTYTDLKVVYSLRSDRASAIDLVFVDLNGSATNKSHRELYGTGSIANSGNDTSLSLSYCAAANATASTFGNGEGYFPNYASSNNKSFSGDNVSENNATTAYQAMQANLWSNTAAITSIKIYPVLGTQFVQYSTATLYGIKNS